MVVDYPNSKKAKKIFLVLFVGGGGGGGGQQQVPDGLDGEEREDDKVRFERRREKDHERRKVVKKKGIKDRDWILKKKEVSIHYFLCLWTTSITDSSLRSYIADVAWRASPEIQNSPAGNAEPCFSFTSYRITALLTV